MSARSDDRRVYSDEEFALILRKAAELSEPAAASGQVSSGFTLAEMKAAAAQAGLDPALVERAAQLLQASAADRPSFLERVIGGRPRQDAEAHFPVALDEDSATRLLSAVRIGVGRSGDAHAGPTGLTWRSSDDAGGVVSLTAMTDQTGTSVRAEVDRRGTLVVGGGLTAVVSFLALAFGGTVVGEIAPGLEIVGGLSGAGVVLALARSFWASSTKAARARVSRLMDSVGGFLGESEDAPSSAGAGTAGQEGDPAAADAEA